MKRIAKHPSGSPNAVREGQFRVSDLLLVITGIGGGIAIIKSVKVMVLYYTDYSFAADVLLTFLFWCLVAKASGRMAISASVFWGWLISAICLSAALSAL